MVFGTWVMSRVRSEQNPFPHNAVAAAADDDTCVADDAGVAAVVAGWLVAPGYCWD